MAVGGRLVIDGETVFVNRVDGAEVLAFTAAGAPVRFVLTRVTGEEPAVASAEEWRFGSVLLEAGALSAAQLREATELLGHLNEAWFGYRSGDPPRPSPGEPLARFDPALIRSRIDSSTKRPSSAARSRSSSRSVASWPAAAWSRSLTGGRRGTRLVPRVTPCCVRRSWPRRRSSPTPRRGQDAVPRSGGEPAGAGERRAA